MSTIMVEIIPDVHYNVEFDSISQILNSKLVSHPYGYIVESQDFTIFLGENGGLKIGVIYSAEEELHQKLNSILDVIQPVVDYFNAHYNKNYLTNFFATRSDRVNQSEKIWDLPSAIYKELKLDSKYNLNSSQFILS
ncbi:hypothetical protein [Paenibacillus sp. GXUN7292]|uniref:hypothetical protein n=1 Tax=Paenibacillus sp. GXUN7292 TaxID=3422499 RepID=UPI003D7D7CD8